MARTDLIRPKSIVDFERTYLGAFALNVLNTALAWNHTLELTAAQSAMFGAWFLPVATLIGFAIPLLLWFFIARRGSVVAKWIATIFLAIGLIGLVIGLARGSYPHGLTGVIGIATTVLQVISIWLIFRPDTRGWFGETNDVETDLDAVA